MVAEGGEGENPLPFSLTAPKRGGGVGGGGGRGAPLETWPTGPWGLDPATLTVPARFLTSCSHLRSSISAAAAASPWGPGQQAPEPCIPAA